MHLNIITTTNLARIDIDSVICSISHQVRIAGMVLNETAAQNDPNK
jgi:hypothetical protein